MLGGTLAFVLATLSLTAPCAGPTCGLDPIQATPQPTVPALADATEDPMQSPQAPHIPTSLSPDTPMAPDIEALLTASLPDEVPRLPAPARDRSAASSHPTDLQPRGDHASPAIAPSHAPRAEASAATTQARAVPSEHAPHPATARVTGAPIDGNAPARTVAALLVGMAAIGLYHRLTKERALEHHTRQRILSLLDDAPGLTTGELAETLDVSYRTARHHAEMLAGFDLIRSTDDGGSQRWYLPGDGGRVREPLTDAERRVLDLITRTDGLHLSEIARRCSMAKATTKFQLDRLAEKAWVRDERVGPLRCFYATEAGQARLADEDP